MDDLREAVARRPSFFQTIKAVGASFFGVRGSRDHQADVSQLNPVHVIIAGVLMAAVFILSLLFIVRLVVR